MLPADPLKSSECNERKGRDFQAGLALSCADFGGFLQDILLSCVFGPQLTSLKSLVIQDFKAMHFILERKFQEKLQTSTALFLLYCMGALCGIDVQVERVGSDSREKSWKVPPCLLQNWGLLLHLADNLCYAFEQTLLSSDSLDCS